MPRRSTAGAAIALLLAACSAPSTTAPRASADPTASASPLASASPSVPPTPTGPAPTETPRPATVAQLSATGPAAREDHTWTVGDGGQAFLFGGRDGATVHGDLWAYDLGSDAWEQLEPAGGPAPRFGHEAAWVDGVGLVIFAGQAGPTFFNDLWSYDPASDAWQQVPASGAIPVSRYGTCAALGPDGRLWISHGFTSDGTRFSDTRAYDFETGEWTDETPAEGGRPVERCLHGCWWTDAGELTLYAGQTTGVTALGDRWSLADGSWTQAEADVLPSDRNLYARARIEGGTLVFGGQALDGTFLGDLWVLPDDSAEAQPVAPGGAPLPARAGAELVRDEARDRWLLFGGRDDAGAHSDVWQIDGSLTGGG